MALFGITQAEAERIRQPLVQQLGQLNQRVEELAEELAQWVQQPAPPADPYAEELRQLDEEARELSQRLTMALRYQRNNRMRQRVEDLEKKVGIASTASTTPAGP